MMPTNEDKIWIKALICLGLGSLLGALAGLCVVILWVGG